jgi:hypothetical protein
MSVKSVLYDHTIPVEIISYGPGDQAMIRWAKRECVVLWAPLRDLKTSPYWWDTPKTNPFWKEKPVKSQPEKRVSKKPALRPSPDRDQGELF